MSRTRPRWRELQALVFVCALTAWCLACSPESGPPAAAAPPPAPPRTVVSLTFDDGLPSHLTAMQMLRAHGMAGTFYISPDLVGTNDYYLGWRDVRALADAGEEIGGHTLHHVVLTTVDADTARREVCGTRTELADRGFAPVTSFAYPDGSADPAVERIVAQCGFGTARGASGLVGPHCLCPAAETLPPADPLNLRTPVASGTTTTLADLQASVAAAEDHGGGWVPLVFHGICDDQCTDELSVSPALLGRFLDWLAPRSARGTVVLTVGQATAGSGPPR